MNNRPALRCEALCKSFNGLRALDHVDLNLEGPAVVGLLGPNGAGKTTLLNTLTGFLRPDSGQCFASGEEVTGLAPERLVTLGVVRSFQHPRLVPSLSALENIELPIPDRYSKSYVRALFTGAGSQSAQRARRECAQMLLDWATIAAVAVAPASSLSYGQLKLLALCCCLATDAKILLLDEPVAGVHPEIIAEIVGRIRDIRERGRLVLVVEHDFDMVRAACERVIAMDRGRIVANGPPEAVFDAPEVHDAFLR